MSEKFTDEQLDAIGSDAPRICVMAGPGSGKTKVLVERVLCRVLDGRLDLRHTLAITFTENAAAEMKTRLADAFEKSSREEHRQMLEQAYISTIHSFCARLLREHAMEAAVDPRFEVLDEVRSGVLKQATLDSVLQSRSLDEPEAFLEFARHFKGDHQEALLRLYDTVRRLGADPADKSQLLRGTGGGDALERLAAGHREAVADAISTLHREYSARKRALSALDFEDLERLTLVMLEKHKALGSAISRRFQEILVDEYQDTSPVQDRIIQLLAAESRLFVVGDAAQSIYGFRNADPEAFQREAKRAEAVRGYFGLRDDFRSRPEIIRAVNCHFDARFRQTGTPFKALRAGSEFVEKDQPSIELLLIAAEEGRVADTRPFEARHLARRVREMVESGTLRVTKGKHRDFGKPLAYGHFAFLFRAASDIKIYERALEDQGIPYFSETGRGFYGAREVRDVVSLLRVLDNSRNEVAVASVLRSPMFGVSDDALYLLADYAHSARGGALSDVLDAAAAVPGMPPEDAERIARFHSLLERLCAERPWRSLAELVREIVRATAYETALLLEPSGRRKVANLRKLADVATALEGAGFDSLNDFVNAVDRFHFEEVREGEAQIESAEEAADAEEAQDDEAGPGAVHLMTMHAAKGLQFPVVVLPDLSRQPPPDTQPVQFLPEFGIAVKFDYGQGKPEKTPALEKIRERRKQQEEAERLRVLFVAMTRAQEHLILSGCLKKSKKGYSAQYALKEICETCAIPLPVQAVDRQWHTITVGKSPDAFRVQLLSSDSPDSGSPDSGQELREQMDPGRGPVARRYRPALEAGSSLGLPVDLEVEAEANRIAAGALKAPPKADSSDFLAAATDVMEFHRCPRRYYLGRYLGYQVAARQSRDREGAVGPVPLADARGSVGTFDEEAPGADQEDEHDFARWELGKAVHEVLARGPEALPGIPDGMRTEVERLANRFWQSEYGRRLGSTGKDACATASDVRRELSVLASLDGRFLRGILDVLTFEDGRPGLLLDYKANDITAARVPEEAAHYRVQMLLYALLVEAAFGSLPREAILFFLAPGVAHRVELTGQTLQEARAIMGSFFAAQKRRSFPLFAGEHCYRCAFNNNLCKAVTSDK